MEEVVAGVAAESAVLIDEPEGAPEMVAVAMEETVEEEAAIITPQVEVREPPTSTAVGRCVANALAAVLATARAGSE